MENAKEWGERSSKFRLWVAAYVLGTERSVPVSEALPQVVQTLGLNSKSTLVRGAYGLQRYYEDIVKRATGLAKNYPKGLDPSDPFVLSHLCPTVLGKEAASNGDADSEFPPAIAEPPPTIAAVAAPPAQTPVVDLDDEFLLDDLGLPGTDDDVSAEPESDLASQQLAALDAYRRDIIRLAKIPTIPSPRPDLGVTFFPTGRFEVAGVDWNYNGQVAGEMIRDCGEDHLLYSRGAPMKATIDFHDWSFSKDKASGTIWLWAVRHQNGKSMRSWLNDGDDQLRFYYTMDAEGVSQTRKKPQAKGSKKFVVADQRHIGPLPLTTGK
jgi:hypothetical protein